MGRELDFALVVAGRLLAPTGATLSDRDVEILLSYASDLEGADDPSHDRVRELFTAALAGFFHLAAGGERLEAPERVGDAFDESIDQTYPGAGAPFRRLAVSYWTLRMLEARLSERHSGILLQQLLRQVVERVERAFFTEPGPGRAVADLARGQREMLVASGAPIDPEAILHANPLLVGNPLA